MSGKVVPDGLIALGGGEVDEDDDAFYRSTILRVLDEEIAIVLDLQQDIPRSHMNTSTWNRHQIKVETLRAIRARFAPDTEED